MPAPRCSRAPGPGRRAGPRRQARRRTPAPPGRGARPPHGEVAAMHELADAHRGGDGADGPRAVRGGVVEDERVVHGSSRPGRRALRCAPRGAERGRRAGRRPRAATAAAAGPRRGRRARRRAAGPRSRWRATTRRAASLPAALAATGPGCTKTGAPASAVAAQQRKRLLGRGRRAEPVGAAGRGRPRRRHGLLHDLGLLLHRQAGRRGRPPAELVGQRLGGLLPGGDRRQRVASGRPLDAHRACESATMARSTLELARSVVGLVVAPGRSRMRAPPADRPASGPAPAAARGVAPRRSRTPRTASGQRCWWMSTVCTARHHS